MNGGQTHLQGHRQQDGGEHHHGRSRIHEAAYKQQQQVDEQQDDDGIVRNADQGVAHQSGDLLQGQDTGKRGGAADDDHGGTVGGAGVGNGREQILQIDLAVDEQAADQRVDRGHSRRLGGSEEAAVDTAQ